MLLVLCAGLLHTGQEAHLTASERAARSRWGSRGVEVPPLISRDHGACRDCQCTTAVTASARNVTSGDAVTNRVWYTELRS